MKLAFDSAVGSWQLASVGSDGDFTPIAKVETGRRSGKLGDTSVAKAEWGTKRVCQECGAKFYDMRRAEIICPKCEAVFELVQPKAKKAPAAPKPATEEKPKPAEPEVATTESDDEEEAIVEDEDLIEDFEDDDEDVEDDEEDIIEDTSDLGDDDDDMAEVIQKPGASEES